MDWSREARFGVLPTALQIMRSVERMLPTQAAPVATPYVAAAATFPWAGVPADAGKYRFEARAMGAAPKTQDLTLVGNTALDFNF